jgi:chromosome partitioning protein
MAQDAHKPIFSLTSADGAIGAHIYAVKDCWEDFSNLATRIASAAGILMR